jgi:hypothetical protein
VVPTYTYYKNMRDKQPRNQVEYVMVVLFEEQIKHVCKDIKVVERRE